MPILKERMIYRVGKSSLAVTLPQNWLKYLGLTAGDTVEVTGNGDLTIRPRKRLENGKARNSQVALTGHSLSRKRTQDEAKGG
jgi:antitoxin component of MazEF toxin-antitoxin module